jgi:hypothetical protein
MDAAEWAKQSREAQGLPETIEDEVILSRVLVLAGSRHSAITFSGGKVRAEFG